jgi:hypothetical protein
MPDYHLLRLGDLTSLITDIEVSLWGSELSFRCVYDPIGKRLPYKLIFQDCQDIRWTVHDLEEVNEQEADLIGISLGENEYRQPAVIHTDIFEVSILYRNIKIDKDW